MAYGTVPFCPFINRNGINDSMLVTGAISLGNANDASTAGKLNAVFVKASLPTANTRASVPHSLGRRPVGFWVVRNKVGGVVYDASNNVVHTSTLLFLKSTVTNAKTSKAYMLLVF